MDTIFRQSVLKALTDQKENIPVYRPDTFTHMLETGIGRIKSDVLAINWDTFLRNPRLPALFGFEFMQELHVQFSRISTLLAGWFRLQFLKEREMLPSEVFRYRLFFSEPDTLDKMCEVCHQLLIILFGDRAVSSLGAYPAFFSPVFSQGLKHFSVVDLTRGFAYVDFQDIDYPVYAFPALPVKLVNEPSFFGKLFDLDIPECGAFRYQASATSEKCILVNIKLLLKYLSEYWDATNLFISPNYAKSRLYKTPLGGKSPWYKNVFWKYYRESRGDADYAYNAFRNRYLDNQRFEAEETSISGIRQDLQEGFLKAYNDTWCVLFNYDKVFKWLTTDCLRMENMRKQGIGKEASSTPAYKTLSFSGNVSFPSQFHRGQVFLGFNSLELPPALDAVLRSPFNKGNIRTYPNEGLTFFASTVISGHLDELSVGRISGFREWIYRVDRWTRDEYRKNIGIRVTKKFTYDQDAAILGLYHPFITKEQKQLIVSRCGGRSWASIVRRARVLRKKKIAEGVFDPGLIPHTNYNVSLNQQLRKNKEKIDEITVDDRLELSV